MRSVVELKKNPCPELGPITRAKAVKSYIDLSWLGQHFHIISLPIQNSLVTCLESGCQYAELGQRTVFQDGWSKTFFSVRGHACLIRCRITVFGVLSTETYVCFSSFGLSLTYHPGKRYNSQPTDEDTTTQKKYPGLEVQNLTFLRLPSNLKYYLW